MIRTGKTYVEKKCIMHFFISYCLLLGIEYFTETVSLS